MKKYKFHLLAVVPFKGHVRNVVAPEKIEPEQKLRAQFDDRCTFATKVAKMHISIWGGFVDDKLHDKACGPIWEHEGEMA